MSDLAYQLDEGDWVGSFTKTNQHRLNRKRTVKELYNLGSDPSFFKLTKDGDDAEGENE